MDPQATTQVLTQSITQLVKNVEVAGGVVIGLFVLKMAFGFVLEWKRTEKKSDGNGNVRPLDGTNGEKRPKTRCVDCAPMTLTMDKVNTIEKLSQDEAKAWVTLTDNMGRLVASSEKQEKYLAEMAMAMGAKPLIPPDWGART